MKLFSRFKQLFIIFCSNTNLHGFIYIVQHERWKIEKFFWILSIFTSMVLSGTLIHKLMMENQRNPTVIYTDQNVVHVTDILFPAITIIPGLVLRNPLNIGLDYEFYKLKLNHEISIKNLTLNELKRLQIASLIARDGFMLENFKNTSILTDDFIQRMRDDFPSMWKINTSKKLKNITNAVYGVYGNWSDSHGMNFTEVLCSTGFCYTFNLPDKIDDFYAIDLLSNDFNSSNVFRLGKGLNENAKPFMKKLNHPVKGPKSGKGLRLKFQSSYTYYHNKSIPNEEFYYFEHSVPKNDFYGTQMVFHEPYEVASGDAIKFVANKNYHGIILITPKVFVTDETMKELSADVRQCYFPYERSLKFFKIYNRVNCEHECLANLTLKSCNCVQFFMVRDPKTRICGIIDEKCFRKVENEFEINKSFCKCYDLSERVEYEVKMVAQKIHKGMYESVPRYDIKFAVDKVMPMSRRKQHTIVGLLSLVGGFFGLFAGFSVLSGFELIYFFIFEPIFDQCRRRDRKIYPENAKRKILTDVKNYCSDFMQNSSVHGFIHIGNNRKGIFERSIWLLLFTSAMILSYLMVKQVHRSLMTHEIMVAMEGKVTSVGEIPFPAITFVDQVQMKSKHLDEIWASAYCMFCMGDPAPKIAKLNEKYGNLNTLKNQVFASLCYDDTSFDSAKPMKDVNETFVYNHTSEFVDYMKNRVPGRDEWSKIQNSTWNTAIKPFFAEMLTKRGFGRTFNIITDDKLLDFDNLSEDFHYSYENNSESQLFPWSTTADDSKGLKIDIMRKNYSEKCTKVTFAVHAPDELPMGLTFHEFHFQNAYEVLISAEIVKADDDLKSFKVNDRKCYFEDERKLKYFKIYTQKNCEMECLSHVAFNVCGCVPFYFLRNSSMEVCDYRRYQLCALNYDEPVLLDQYDHLYDVHKVCKCHPLCNSIKYSYEIQEEYFHVTDWYEINKQRRKDKKPEIPYNYMELITTFMFRYKDGEYFALLRYQPFKLVDFLSYVGGILGLFAGISVLSIVEVFYFFSLRLVSDFVKYFKKA